MLRVSLRGAKPFGWIAISAFLFVGSAIGILIEQPLIAAPNSHSAQVRPRAAIDIVDLVKSVSPAVVSITTQTRTPRQAPSQRFGDPQPNDEFWRRFFGGPYRPEGPRQQQSAGSGFIIDGVGLILTNHHVVENASKITVSLSDDHTFEAQVIGTDPKTDIALLKINAGYTLPTVPLGNSETLEIGEGVLAIGNPFGLEHTVTSGIVSAKGRRIGAGPYDNFIQTDASINPGNSGGPLINRRGEVVGVNTAIFSRGGGNIGIGFAIPVNLVKELLPPLKQTGRVTRGWLGIVIQTVTPTLAESLGLDAPQGALVANVSQNSPAEQGGLTLGDVIVEFDQTIVKQSNDLPMIVARTPVGKSVPVKVYRDGSLKTLSVRIGELKEEHQAANPKGEHKLGLTVQPITPQMAESLAMDRVEGVVVTAIQPDSPAARAGLLKGDLILKVNKTRIAHMAAYQKALAGVKKNDAALFLVQRGGTTLFFAAKNIG
jgi:serine protease Do